MQRIVERKMLDMNNKHSNQLSTSAELCPDINTSSHGLIFSYYTIKDAHKRGHSSYSVEACSTELFDDNMLVTVRK